ncbi:MAG: DNA methylase [Lentisphaerae bacterium]|nr:DNA methylase [Lentisphaerota bacterium]
MTNKYELSDKHLKNLESIIQKFRKDFYAVGKALKEIHEKHYYQKLSFKTFESYVNLRWDMSRSHAYRLIDAVLVIDNITPIGDILPKNEAQVRVLSKLDSVSQQKVWRNFLKTHMPITASNIKKFVSAYLGEQKKSLPVVEVVSKNYKEAVSAMLSQITVAQNEDWKSTSQKTALYWHKVIKEKILWG